MAINGLCNKHSGPGGSTRRLHQIVRCNGPKWIRCVFEGAKQDRHVSKDMLFARYGSAVSGPFLQVPMITIWPSLLNY